ncbi:hypothetical protein PVAND_009366 [Polypedilum vanderplanki]|uniref:Phosphoenolpyruvate synthase n=1 Tax=Polypedilum vanderplanki TaxID=319348 RepID=A0A9J6CCI5_POLVA|nr:hypothetical protein PVAND_009366 [Polypedilum vanderplanki]
MEIDFLYLMSLVAITTLTFCLYRLLIEENNTKTKDHYTRPAWNFFLKKIYAEYVLNKKKKQQSKLIKELKNYESETPKILTTEDSSDSQKIFGTDHDGNSLMIKFTRRRHRIAEIWMILRIKNGQQYTVYTLPDHPHTKIANTTPRVFEGAGLKLECLVPFSRWRITYMGMLRKGISQNLSNDESNLYFVRLNFIWMTASEPIFWPYEWSTELMATALATEQWRDGKWKNLINLKDNGGYTQFGATKGEVRIYENNYIAYSQGQLPKVNTIEMNFPGIRLRRWGRYKNENLHRTGVIYGNIKDGTAFEVGAFSSKVGVTHSQFGNIRVANGDVMPIEWTDFHLASLGEYQDQLPEATIVQIEAGGKNFIAVVTFRNHEKVPLFGGSAGERWNAFVVPVDIMCNTVRGYGSAIFWYPRNIRRFEFEEFPTKIKRIFHRNDVPSPEKQLISFADKEAQSVSVAGGKGCSLAILRIIQETKDDLLDHTGRNFQVLNALVDQFSGLHRSMQFNRLMKNEPPKTGRQRSGSITKTIFPDPNDVDDVEFFTPQGFIISVSAFNEHVRKYVEIRKAIDELRAIAYEKIEGNIEEACKKVQKAFESTVISDELKALIIPKLDQINFDANARFAVRSSGLTEDAEELSSSGQNQTFLGLRTNEEVFEAIIKCWSSLFSFQSVLYRKQNIQPVASAMAVVIQKMVQAESAGVLFSRHFLNGDPSVIVITANYGLGESVVSAKSESDIFLIKKDYKGENVKLLATIVGDKKFIIEMATETAVEEVELDDEKRRKLCLSEDIALRLAKLAILLERFFGTPRDIEFAVTKDKKIYLLQSRSITALNNFTDYEIIHETDAAVLSCINNVCTKANVGEVFQEPQSKLCQTTIKPLIEKVNRKMVRDKFQDLYTKMFPTFSNHIFMDVYQMFLRGVGDKIKLIDTVIGYSVFGNDVLKNYPQLLEIARQCNAYTSKLYNGFIQMYVVFEAAFFMNYYMKTGTEALQQLKGKMNAKNLNRHKTASDVFDLIKREMETFEIIIQMHLEASTNSIFINLISFSILTHGAKELTIEHQRDITYILSSIGDIESANIPQLLSEIANSIKASGKEKRFLEIDNKKAIEWLESNVTEAYQLFNKFIERHGHRALNEFDLIAKTWEMCPEEVINMIKTTLNFPSQSIDKKKIEIDDIMSQIKTPLTRMRYKILKKMISRCHKGVRLREEAKSKLIDAVNEIRRAVIYLSQKMVNEGLLPDKELIFHLQFKEIKSLIQNRDSLLINKAERRRKLNPKVKELRFDEICFGIPRPHSEQQDNQNFEVNEGDIIVKGMPVCSGIVTGRACVIKTFSQIDKLQKGDILITYCTDIAWSPYFNLLSGLATEIGGLISHGAVVARECNLPCIVGCTRATDKIKTGDKITLNADEGVIIKTT